MTPCFIVSPFSIAVDSFPGGTHYITDAVSVAPLSDEHKSRLVEYLDRANDQRLSQRVRCRPAFIVPYNEISYLRSLVSVPDKETAARRIHRFSLEYFASVSLPVAAFSYDGTQVTSHSLDRHDLNFERQEHVLNVSAWEKHAAYLKFIYGTIDKSPSAEIVMGRLSRAFDQGPSPDGIIDIAIALECLVNAQTEIKFQFSLFHSLMYAESPDERASTFKLLQSLYDIRSQTVHGGQPKGSGQSKIKEIIQNWTKCLDIGRQNLTYYMAFCQRNGSRSWDSHLRDLSFGNSRSGVGDL